MEENKEFNTEEVTEEVKETEAVDKASFADVNYSEEIKEPEKKEKASKGGLWGVIIAVIAVAFIIAAIFVKITNRPLMGAGNRYSFPIGLTKGDYLYYGDFTGTSLSKTEANPQNFKPEKVASSAAYLTLHKGEIYYYDGNTSRVCRLNEGGEDEVIYEGASGYHQYVGDYVYFSTFESNYGGFVKRVPLSGGEAETVLGVYASRFVISEKNIIYYDPAINKLLITTIENARKKAAEANGEAQTSYDIQAIVLADRYTDNINVCGKDVYFLDVANNGTICHLDMRTGEIEEVNFGTQGFYLNTFGDYLFFVGTDQHLYRINSDGKDIRDLTGNAYKEIAGVGIYDDRIVFCGLTPKLNSETMQTEYEPIIAVMDFEGEYILSFPATDNTNVIPEISSEVPEVTEEIPEETIEEIPAETEG